MALLGVLVPVAWTDSICEKCCQIEAHHPNYHFYCLVLARPVGHGLREGRLPCRGGLSIWPPHGQNTRREPNTPLQLAGTARVNRARNRFRTAGAHHSRRRPRSLAPA